MAAFNLESASPYALKYSVSPAGTAEITRLQMIADAANGPLKAAMQAATGSDWSRLTLESKCSLYVHEDGTPGAKVGAALGISGSEKMFAATDGALAVVELRFNHSTWR